MLRIGILSVTYFANIHILLVLIHSHRRSPPVTPFSPTSFLVVASLSAKITCRTSSWTSGYMLRSKVGLITIIAPFGCSPLMSARPQNDPRPRYLLFWCPTRIVPTGSVLNWNAPVPPVVPLIVEPYDLEYIYPRSYDNAMRYTSSGVFFDRHSSFCASLLFMFTINTFLRVLVSNAPKLHRADSPLKTEWNCSKDSPIFCFLANNWNVS